MQDPGGESAVVSGRDLLAFESREMVAQLALVSGSALDVLRFNSLPQTGNQQGIDCNRREGTWLV